MLKVALITKVSGRPDQWRGYTAGKRPIYVRYANDHLSVFTGPPKQPLATSKDEMIATCLIGSDTTRLSYRHLRDLTRDALNLPEHETPATDSDAARLIALHVENERAREHVEARGFKRVNLSLYWDGHELVARRGPPDLERLFDTASNHDCRALGCSEFGHVLLRIGR